MQQPIYAERQLILFLKICMIRNSSLSLGLAGLCVLLSILLLWPKQGSKNTDMATQSAIETVGYGALYDEFVGLSCLWAGVGLDEDTSNNAKMNGFVVDPLLVGQYALVETCKGGDGRSMQLLALIPEAPTDEQSDDLEYRFVYETENGDVSSLDFSGMAGTEIAGPYCRVQDTRFGQEGENIPSGLPRHVIIECRIGEYLTTNVTTYAVDLARQTIQKIATCIEETKVVVLDELYTEYYIQETRCEQ